MAKPRNRIRTALEHLDERIVPHAPSGFGPEPDWLPALGMPVASGSTGSAGTSAAPAAAAPAVPAYSSLPGAKATLYLDFGGDYEAQWGSWTNITTPAFNTDSDPTTFSQSELNAIHDVWSYVAEDYAPFNVNVTTVDPGSYPDGVALKVVIGGDGGWIGPPGLYGGFSYTSAFSTSYLPNVSFVFSSSLQNNPRFVGDASAHEAGHEFGLDHQSQYSGS